MVGMEKTNPIDTSVLHSNNWYKVVKTNLATVQRSSLQPLYCTKPHPLKSLFVVEYTTNQHLVSPQLL